MGCMLPVVAWSDNCQQTPNSGPLFTRTNEKPATFRVFGP